MSKKSLKRRVKELERDLDSFVTNYNKSIAIYDRHLVEHDEVIGELENQLEVAHEAIDALRRELVFSPSANAFSTYSNALNLKSMAEEGLDLLSFFMPKATEEKK